jgi:F0F1-type ATP synthase epsilon subunit
MNKFGKTIDEIIEKVEELIKQGNLRRIIIKDQNGDKYIEIPIIIGGVFTIAAPVVSIIAILAGIAANFSVEIIKKEDSNKSEIYEIIKDE